MTTAKQPTIRGNWLRMSRYVWTLALFLAPLVLLAVAGVLWVDARNRDRVCTQNLRAKLAAFPEAPADLRVLVLGDSRAEFGVDPRVLARKFEVAPESCLNLAVAAGDPSAAMKALRTRPDLLRSRPIVLLSVSIYHLHDGAGYYTEDLISDCGFMERLELLGPGRLTSFYVDSAERLIRGGTIRPAVRGISGYQPQTQTLHETSDGGFARVLDGLHWYREVRYDGVRARVLRRHLEWLASLEMPVFLFEGPVAPSWRDTIRGTEVDRASRAFTEAMTALCARAGVRFLGFHDHGGLTDADFLDWLHTNEKGSAVFTGWLADAVRAARGDEGREPK